MDTVKQLLDVILHLDKHLNEWAAQLGSSLYVVLFLIVFCETGLVVTPFLPGDSLLFAIGALSGTDGSPISLPLVMVLLFAAAVIGDAVNYQIGKKIGPAAFKSESSRLLNKKHLYRTQAFYEKHGGKTIIIARFVPIVRTFAPFVAGIGDMKYSRFFTFNVVGAAAWVVLLTGAGRALAHVEFVKSHFEIIVLAIVGISVLPMVVEVLRARRAGPQEAAPEPATK